MGIFDAELIVGLTGPIDTYYSLLGIDVWFYVLPMIFLDILLIFYLIARLKKESMHATAAIDELDTKMLVSELFFGVGILSFVLSIINSFVQGIVFGMVLMFLTLILLVYNVVKTTNILKSKKHHISKHKLKIEIKKIAHHKVVHKEKKENKKDKKKVEKKQEHKVEKKHENKEEKKKENKLALGEKLKDTKYLIGTSFNLLSVNSTKKPLINMIILTILFTSVLFFGLFTIFVRQLYLWGFILLILALGLFMYRFIFNINQKALQSVLAFSALKNEKVTMPQALSQVKPIRGELFKLALIDFFIVSRRQTNNLLVNIFVSSLKQVWAIASNFLLPVIIIEQKKIKSAAPIFKKIGSNVPQNLVNVFENDFVGKSVSFILIPIYLIVILIGFVISYVLAPSTPQYNFVLGNYVFSTIPLLAIIYFIVTLGMVISTIVGSVKVLYYTTFYMGLAKKRQIDSSLSGKVERYLTFGPKPQIATAAKQAPLEQKDENQVKQSDEPTNQNAQVEDEELKRVLLKLDDLLGNLPQDQIDAFANSEEFELYQKIMERYS